MVAAMEKGLAVCDRRIHRPRDIYAAYQTSHLGHEPITAGTRDLR